MIELKFAELQTPLFLAGINFGVKLDIGRRPIRLLYDKTDNILLLNHKTDWAIIPLGNVASMTPIEPLNIELKETPTVTELSKIHTQHTQMTAEAPKRGRPPGVSKAQVSTPTSHVFDEPK